jgi:hypothetical protein
MAQKVKQAVPDPKQGGRSSALLIGLGLIFAAGVGFAVGYTVGKKGGMQPVQLVGSREKPQPTPPSRRERPPPEPEDPLKAPKTPIEVAAHSPTKGPKNAPVTIVEFSEFQ